MDDDILAPAPLNSVPDTCDFLHVRRSKVYELLREGEISAIKIGSRTLITGPSLEKYIRKLLSMRTTGGLSRGR